MNTKALALTITAVALTFASGVFAQSNNSPAPTESLLESSGSGQIPPPIEEDKKLLRKVERYSNQVLDNYRNNLTALDNIFSSTQKYYLEKVKPEKESDKAEQLITEIQNKRDTTHQSLDKLKKRTETIKKSKKVDKNNKSGLKKEGEDSIKDFEEYKSKVTEFVQEVKDLTEEE